jgi:hypothetical protein
MIGIFISTVFKEEYIFKEVEVEDKRFLLAVCIKNLIHSRYTHKQKGFLWLYLCENMFEDCFVTIHFYRGQLHEKNCCSRRLDEQKLLRRSISLLKLLLRPTSYAESITVTEFMNKKYYSG